MNRIPQPEGLTPMVDTPIEYDGPIQYLNWNGYKVAVLDSARLNAEFFNEIRHRERDNRSCIIICTGSPGEGKSWLTTRFGQILDPDLRILDIDNSFFFRDEEVANNFVKKTRKEGYDVTIEPFTSKDKIDEGFAVKIVTPPPNRDPSQVTFDREHMLYLIGNNSPLKRGSVILIDEAQYAMGSRRWYEDIQKDLMESIESVRSRGFIILIVSLHLELLDKVIRKFVLSYMFHIENRGIATIYRLYTPRFETNMRKKRIGQLHLKIPDFDTCKNPNCLRCNFLHGENRRGLGGENPDKRRCMTTRATYERRKRRFVGDRSKKAEEKASQKNKKQKHNRAELLGVLYENKGSFTYTDKHRITPASISQILYKKLELEYSSGKCSQLRNLLELDHPELDRREK